MADDKCRRHTNIHFLTLELLLDHLLRFLRDRLQTFNEQRGDARNEFHHSTHGNSESKNQLDIELCCNADECAYNDTEHQWLTQHTELLFQSLCINVELREAWNHVKPLIDGNSK